MWGCHHFLSFPYIMFKLQNVRSLKNGRCKLRYSDFIPSIWEFFLCAYQDSLITSLWNKTQTYSAQLQLHKDANAEWKGGEGDDGSTEETVRNPIPCSLKQRKRIFPDLPNQIEFGVLFMLLFLSRFCAVLLHIIQIWVRSVRKSEQHKLKKKTFSIRNVLTNSGICCTHQMRFRNLRLFVQVKLVSKSRRFRTTGTISWF